MATQIPANEAALDAWTAAAAANGEVVRQTELTPPARGIISDSRSVTPRAAFVALRGQKYDGHDFLAVAVKAGAALIVCERGHGKTLDATLSATAKVDIVEVDDTLLAWGAFARAHLRAWRRGSESRRVLALTGSAGKTTTKELCAALLSTRARGHSTFGNLNNRIGVPAVAFGARKEAEWCVIEAGMSEPGEIRAIAASIEADVALVLNANLAHAGGVGGKRSDVAREKGALFAALASDGIAIANADDPAVMGQLARTSARRVRTFGESASADYRLVNRARDAGQGGWRVELATPTAESIMVDLPIPGPAAAIDLVAAWAAAEAVLGAPLDHDLVQAALDKLHPIAGRMRFQRLDKGPILIDDSYNANPASMANAIATLREIASADRRRSIAVLGEMRELGDATEAEHTRLAGHLAKAEVAVVIGCGGAIDSTLRALREVSGGAIEVVETADSAAAAKALCERIASTDVVLVKGSRGARTERVVDALVAMYTSPSRHPPAKSESAIPAPLPSVIIKEDT